MFRHWVVRVDGMIHPAAASDPFLAPLHRSFLISSFASGAAALIVLPLHLALAGPPHAAVLLVLTWMVSQWPLALFLSRSGGLNRVIGLSSGLFACLVAGICLLTGGTGSFALVWLLVPLMETAFSTDRRTPVLLTLLCGALLAGIALMPLPATQIAVPDANVPFYATLGALLYTGVLCFRLTLDRLLALRVERRSQETLQRVGQGMSDVVCELSADGAIRILAGPITKLIGPLPIADGEDWLFPRLHVADRPLYLTCLSSARHSGDTRSLTVRFRVGASQPGEIGQADYIDLALTLRPTGLAGSLATEPEHSLLLTLSADVRDVPETRTPADGEFPAGRLSRSLVEFSDPEPEEAIADRKHHGRQTDPVPVSAASPLGESLPTGRMAFESAADTEREPLDARDPGMSDITASLEQCRDLLAPVAARRGVMLDLAAGADLPMVAARPKCVRQALYFLLADMIETCGEGALLTVSTEISATGLDCLLTVRNRPSGMPWCVDGSELVFDSASKLLVQTGGSLSVRSMKGAGDCVVVHLPLGAGKPAARPLAKSA